MKVCCIIVTYGDRFRYLSQVVEEAFRQGVARVVIVDNGSVPASATALAALSAQNPSSVIVHTFAANEGSAKGFKTGMEIGRQTDCDFLWLLDDDNLPDPGALQHLEDFWKGNGGFAGRHDLVALASMRRDRQVFVNALQQRKTDPLLWPKNSYMGFHLLRVLGKVAERLSPRRLQAAPVTETAPLKIDLSFYGGLFFHKDLLLRVGLPEEDLVLYSDDFWFTSSITKMNGEIWLVPGSTLADIDVPYYLPAKKGLLYHSCLDGKSSALVYYSSRNAVYFTRRNLVTNPLLFQVNKWMFLGIITGIGLLRGKLDRLKVVYEAVQDGEKGRLGKKGKYRLG